MSRIAICTVVIAALSGCSGQGDGPALGSESRAGLSNLTMETSLSCAGHCGGLVETDDEYCGCDDACEAYGDCCDDKAAVCAIPQATCEDAGGQCGSLTASGVLCPDGYEPDGDAGTCLIGAGCCMPVAPPPEPRPEKAPIRTNS